MSDETYFDGESYDEALDKTRLTTQFHLVKAALLGPAGSRWTLPKLAAVSRGSVQGVSARIRDLRKPRFGSYDVRKQRVAGGVWEYYIHMEPKREDKPEQVGLFEESRP